MFARRGAASKHKGLSLVSSLAVLSAILVVLLQTASATIPQVRYWSGASGYMGFPLQVGSGVAYVYTTPSASVSGNTVVTSSFDVAAYANNTVGNAVATGIVIADQSGASVPGGSSTPYSFSIHFSNYLWAGVMQANVGCGTNANATATAFYILGLTVNNTGTGATVLNSQVIMGPQLVSPLNGTPLPPVPWYVPRIGTGSVAACWSQGTYGWGTYGLNARCLPGQGTILSALRFHSLPRPR